MRGGRVPVFLSALKSNYIKVCLGVRVSFYSLQPSGTRDCGNQGRQRPGPMSQNLTLRDTPAGQDERPGMELNVTGSQAGQSRRDKGLIRVQTENRGRTAGGGFVPTLGTWEDPAGWGRRSHGTLERCNSAHQQPQPRSQSRPLSAASLEAQVVLFAPPLGSYCAST